MIQIFGTFGWRGVPSFSQYPTTHMNMLTKFSEVTRARWPRWGSALVCATVLAGCANLGGTQKPEEVVLQRSNDYWKARMAGEVAKTYAVTTPSYRALNDQEKFRLKYGAVPILKGGEVISVTCEEARCEVRKSFTTSTPLMTGARIPIAISEIWVKQDGQWWLFVE